MTAESLLPPSARTKTEKEIEQAAFRALPIDIPALASPETAPDAFVPFLAWGTSTDLWDRNWSIEKKRAVVKAWWRLHRLKGTIAGIEEAVRFFDARVVAVRRPPDATYPDPVLTKAERDAYLARFQQLRLYSFRDRGIAGFGAYLSGGYRLPKLFPDGGAFPAYSDAAVRLGERAFLFDPLTGDEIAVKRVSRIDQTETRQAVRFDEILLPGSAGFAAFLDRPPRAKRFTASVGAAGRRYTVAVNTEYSERTSTLHVSSVLPSAQPISVLPKREKVRGVRVIGQRFPGAKGTGEFVARPTDGIRRAFLPASTAGLRIFDVIFLYDPARLADRRDARTFLGRTRLGMPAYHARITIETRGKVSPFAARQFVAGFLMSSDKARLAKAIEAIRIEKALRDKVLVTAKTMRPAKVGDGFKIGTINVGTWVRDL